jgi:predicted nucleic acid-binding Zn ribbon protein
LLAGVQERWADAVGWPVSEQASPVSEQDGVITISCRSAVWAAELSLLENMVIEQLNGRLEQSCQVRALRFVTRPS